MSEPMIKGAVMRDFVVWYGAHYGPAYLRRTGDRLPQHIRDRIDLEHPTFRLLGSLWYPVEIVHAFLEAIAHGRTPAEMNRLLHDANRNFLRTGMRQSVYRFLFERLVTPEIYAVLVPRFWKQLHSTGERRIKIIRPGFAESTVANWPGHHPLLCTMVIETMCAVFETTGCKNVSWERVSCVSDGASECKTHVTWGK